MEKKKFHVIIVDDTMGEKDPFVVELKLEYQNKAEISYFEKVEDAMNFVDRHMSERIIIIMDCLFGSVWQGIDAVVKLREKTALVYVIMMSANNVNQLQNKDIMSLINMDNIFFIKNTDIKGAKEKIEKICNLWNVRFDCILEEWIIRHPEDGNKYAYREVGGKSYTWTEMLQELRRQTSTGKVFEGMINDFYIYTLLKSKEQNG